MPRGELKAAVCPRMDIRAPVDQKRGFDTVRRLKAMNLNTGIVTKPESRCKVL